MAPFVLTLADYAASPNLLVSGVAKTMREVSPFFDRLPIADVGTLAVKVFREPTGGLNEVGWRNIGEQHGSVKQARPEELEEMGYSFGNTIAVDKVYVKDKSSRLVDPMTWQTTQTVKAMSFGFVDKTINGILPT